MSNSIAVKRAGAAVAAVAAAFAFGVGTVGTSGEAEAKIKPVDVSCTNNGGHQPAGQQPSCQGEGLTQETENQNPAGHAPPGQN